VKAAREQPGPLWFLGRLVRHRPGLFAGHLVNITLAVYALPLLPGLLARALLDRVEGGEAAVGLSVATVVALFGALAVVELVGRLFGPVLTMTLRQHSEVLLRRNLLDRVLSRPGARALPSSPGDALVRFTKDPEEVGLALDFIADPVGQAVCMTFVVVVLARIDAFLTATVIVPATIVMLVSRMAGPRIAEARRKRQESVSGVSGLLGDAFSAVATVQAAGAEERVTRRLVELGEARRRATLRDVVVDQVVNSFASNTATVATGVLLLVAARRARTGDLSVGDFAVFASYLRWLATAVGFVGHVMTTLRQASVSVERMGDVLQAPAAGLVTDRATHLRGPVPPAEPAVPTPDLGPLEVLDVDGLRFVHPSTGRGIKDVTFRVARGEVVVVTGRIGSGKTTLLRAIAGLLPAEAGAVKWNDREVPAPDRFFVPPRLAYTAQVPRLFSGTVRENVLLGREADEASLAAAAHAAVLERDLEALAHGWDTVVGARGVTLSGGQLQRTAAARMFVRHADLLLLDDLSSALDVETEEELWRRLLSADDRPTCVVVTHRRAVLERADRIVVLRDGEVDALGSLRDVLGSSDEMRALWALDTMGS
jgi:ATP-binding cassette, subfamily B, bacterial